jgi:hypothetical protein
MALHEKAPPCVGSFRGELSGSVHRLGFSLEKPLVEGSGAKVAHAEASIVQANCVGLVPPGPPN